ncbi:adenosylcobinamide-GDP ribazoletransferase [Ulvibacterium sp.]|uniref:adenosylcobinamide-GDP ribazoletransferase n=1 Tax=Ulvibacterium sp. TaxID=2665914 RepID=UPI0026120C93|nr:adenosylcobinamide-GDP ribazoletransferase [Ulvibacterium sp.]
MKEELKIFLTAVMFYTRIPCPSWVDHSPDYINKSVRYFPLIGWIVGTVSGLGLVLGNWLIGPWFAAFFCIAISVWLTGAFHEDGFADVCDGFGGGWTKDQILKIMKDSRVGTYAVVGLLLLFLLKGTLLVKVSGQYDYIHLLLIIINGHTISRVMAAMVIFTHQYVREDGSSKAKPVAQSYSPTNVVLVLIFGLLPTAVIALLMGQLWWCFVPIVLYLVKIYLSNIFQKKIGGYTGDCLGATQQVVEVVYYFLIVLAWKFI